jgi:hypothetical protein
LADVASCQQFFWILFKGLIRSPGHWSPTAMPHFEVRCRIDAYADYVAIVRATDPGQAAQLARDNHNGYYWQHEQTAEFDARLYVTLDKDRLEIEETQCGDF